MKKMLLTAAVAVLCSGCVEYTEEIWFNEDMSGKIRMDIVIDEKLAALSEQEGRTDNVFSETGIRNRFSNIEGVKLIEAGARTEGEKRVSACTLMFESLDALGRISNAKKETNFLGDFYIAHGDSGRVAYTRTIVMSDDAKSQLVDQVLKGYTWSYTVHFPGKILGVDRTANFIDKDTNTVTWVYSLADLTKKPRTMKVVFTPRTHIDYKAITVAGIVFVIFFFVTFRFMKKMR
ncbi:hypothetical protein LLG96_12130 [bacterium]|nr:hypothetical protein [bacterium]